MTSSSDSAENWFARKHLAWSNVVRKHLNATLIITFCLLHKFLHDKVFVSQNMGLKKFLYRGLSWRVQKCTLVLGGDPSIHSQLLPLTRPDGSSALSTFRWLWWLFGLILLFLLIHLLTLDFLLLVDKQRSKKESHDWSWRAIFWGAKIALTHLNTSIRLPRPNSALSDVSLRISLFAFDASLALSLRYKKLKKSS